MVSTATAMRNESRPLWPGYVDTCGNVDKPHTKLDKRVSSVFWIRWSGKETNCPCTAMIISQFLEEFKWESSDTFIHSQHLLCPIMGELSSSHLEHRGCDIWAWRGIQQAKYEKLRKRLGQTELCNRGVMCSAWCTQGKRSGFEIFFFF